MKFVATALSGIAYVLVILGTIFCLNSNSDFRQPENFFSASEANVKFRVEENRQTEYARFPLVREDNAVKSLITEGSSTTDGYGVTNEYPKQLAVLFGANYYKQTVNLFLDPNNLWTIRNVGNGGDTMIEMTAQYAVQVLPYYNPSLNVNYLTLQAGSNDVANGRTTAALKADIAAYVAKAKADGFVVGVCTIFHRVGNDVAKVSDYNNWLRAGNSGADFIVDLAAHPILSDATNRAYFIGDGIHTNNAGQAVIASVFADAFAPVGASTVTGIISGRALTATDRGIANVTLTLTDAAGNTRTARTSTLGYYRFKGVAIGQTYNLAAKAKRFAFIQPSQVLSINESAVNVNFIANP